MKKAFVSGVAETPNPALMLRPSSARRLGNLRALVAEFAGRDIGYAGVAVFLGCSLTAARNYVGELLDAGVIASLPVRQAAGCVDRTLYRGSADPLVVHAFLAALARSHTAAMPAWRDTAEAEAPPDAERIHRTWLAADFSFGAGRSPARRDPLVAALFGAAQAVQLDLLDDLAGIDEHATRPQSPSSQQHRSDFV